MVITVVVMFSLLPSAADDAITVVGEVSDSQCAFTVHSNTGSHGELMKSGLFGTTAADCVHTCIRFGGRYVLVDHVKKKIYRIANPEVVAAYASKQVHVRGTLDNKGVLSIQEIEAAKGQN
jgi:hypothetical protein